MYTIEIKNQVDKIFSEPFNPLLTRGHYISRLNLAALVCVDYPNKNFMTAYLYNWFTVLYFFNKKSPSSLFVID